MQVSQHAPPHLVGLFSLIGSAARSLWRVVGHLTIEHIFANARPCIAMQLLDVLSPRLSHQDFPSDFVISQLHDSDKLRLIHHGTIRPATFEQLEQLRFVSPYNALAAASAAGMNVSVQWLEEYAAVMVVSVSGPNAGTVAHQMVPAVVDAILAAFGHTLDLLKVFAMFGKAACGVLAADNRLCTLTSSLEEASRLISSWKQGSALPAFFSVLSGAPSGVYDASDVRSTFLTTPLGKRALRHMEVYRFVRDSDIRTMGVSDVALLGLRTEGKRRMLTWLVDNNVKFTLSSAAKIMKGHTPSTIQSGGIREPAGFEIVDACSDVGKKGVLPMLLALGDGLLSRAVRTGSLESMVKSAWTPHRAQVREMLTKLA